MRILLAVALFTCATAAAADKPEDLAKDTALAFLKAAKARNLDDAVKLTGTPYFSQKGDEVKLLDKADDVRAALKTGFDRPINEETFPTDVVEIVPAAKVKEKYGAKTKPETFELIEKALGKDGFVVVLGKDKKPTGGVMIAMKDGKAKIVGIPR
jgi:hypothetical protein